MTHTLNNTPIEPKSKLEGWGRKLVNYFSDERQYQVRPGYILALLSVSLGLVIYGNILIKNELDKVKANSLELKSISTLIGNKK